MITILFLEMFSIGWDVFSDEGVNFDLIVLDPPTFSRDRKSKIFRIQDDYGELANLACQCLNRDGRIFCSTNFRGMTFNEFLSLLKTAVARRLKPLPARCHPILPEKNI